MEETNYSRKSLAGEESMKQSGTQTPIAEMNEKNTSQSPDEKTVSQAPGPTTEEGLGIVSLPKKTYMQKLKLFQPGAFSKKNEIPGMMLRPLLYAVQLAVVAYSGFSYG